MELRLHNRFRSPAIDLKFARIDLNVVNAIPMTTAWTTIGNFQFKGYYSVSVFFSFRTVDKRTIGLPYVSDKILRRDVEERQILRITDCVCDTSEEGLNSLVVFRVNFTV
jgi:hypothetical protein